MHAIIEPGGSEGSNGKQCVGGVAFDNQNFDRRERFHQK
jgi:hypothetical protein